MRYTNTQNPNSVQANDNRVSQTDMTRRGFLFSTGLAFSIVAMPYFGKSAAAASEAQDATGFRQLSEFLTGKPIASPLAERAQAALIQVDPSFAEKSDALQKFVASVNAPSIDILKTDQSFRGELRETALTIISAYYTGFAGTPQAHKAQDNTAFITFTQAMTFDLTHHYTPIPSYSRWGTGYWEFLPDPV